MANKQDKSAAPGRDPNKENPTKTPERGTPGQGGQGGQGGGRQGGQRDQSDWGSDTPRR